MEWTRILAYITGTVDQELLLRNEYLAAENGILKAQLKGCLRLSDAERAKLGEIGHRLGRKSLSEVATTAVCTENLNPNVLTMKSAQYGARIYDAGSLNLARDRRILVQ